MTETETPGWLTVGADVVTMILHPRPGQSHEIKRSTVARIGKRDVVLADGQRFNVQRLSRKEGGSYGWTVVLLPADDPRIAEAATKDAQRAREVRARNACYDYYYQRGRTRPMTAEGVIRAVAPLLRERGDQIIALLNSDLHPARGETMSDPDVEAGT
jgi:hypothetical protein